jgi:hypothetical protein
MTELILERRAQQDETGVVASPSTIVLLTPPIGEDYWEYRVVVADGQAVVGFPKFTTIGIGFAVEDYDWNTNLPYTCDTDMILNHIWKNAGPNVTDRDRVRQAIDLVRAAATEDRDG